MTSPSRSVLPTLRIAALLALAWISQAEGRSPESNTCEADVDEVAALQHTRTSGRVEAKAAQCNCHSVSDGDLPTCVPSEGSDGPFTFPVEDPEACNCSGWNPAEKPDGLGCPQHHPIPGAPWGLVFFGVSFSQAAPNVATANAASVTHQTKFDFNRLQDRGMELMCGHNDDGWLAGGGNSPASFVLPNIDSSHAELVHPGSICGSLAPRSEVQPNLSSYETDPEFITGAPLLVLIHRIVSEVSFEPIRVVPTGGSFTPTDEYQLRFNYEDDEGRLSNPTMAALYTTLANVFSDIQTLQNTDPFHVSMIRSTSFCSNESRNELFNRNEKLTIKPWKRWAARSQGQLGVLLNDELYRYKDKAGGFYLFITRNRPLIYFAPGESVRANSTAYYAQWWQEGKPVAFANPMGGEVTEVLIRLPHEFFALRLFILKDPILRYLSTWLCRHYSFDALPTTEWTPPSFSMSVEQQ